jgi:hypothetical protein
MPQRDVPLGGGCSPHRVGQRCGDYDASMARWTTTVAAHTDTGSPEIQQDQQDTSPARGPAVRGHGFLETRPDPWRHGNQRYPRIPTSTAGARAATASASRADDPKPRSDPAAADVHGVERRTAATACAWCYGPITRRSRGPIPQWCSAACRHRAWDQARAAASGLCAVEIVERRVEVQVPLVPTRRDWPRLLGELAAQLNDGRVYDRDLPALAPALRPVLEAYGRRAHLTGAPFLY